MPPRTVIATRADAGVRIDHILSRRLDDIRQLTRTQVQAWIRTGGVTINGRAVRRPAARAATADVIEIQLPDNAAVDAAAPPPAVMAEEPAVMAGVRVLHEDEHLLAVDKPPGLIVHPTYRHPTGTLMNGLLWHARQWPSTQRPSLVGRLDRWTSGIVLIARTAAVHTSLQRALATSASHKDYLAVVYGGSGRRRGTLAWRLHRDIADRRRVVVSSHQGQESFTAYERLARVAAPRAGLALVRCRLLTGRMHQIRVHLSAHGWPIVGDAVYGDPRWSTVRNERLAAALAGFARQALHAWRLSFPHPMTGRRLRIDAPLPADMETLLTLSGLERPALD